MENISHALCGAAIARAGFEDSLGKKTALITGAVAGNFADIDILAMPLLGQDHYMLWHRGITHSLLALLVLPPVLAWAISQLARAPLRPLVTLCYLAYASHLLMDVPTSWGTMLLLPFDDTRFSTHWVYIFDLFFWFILSLPFWMNRVLGEPVLLARFSLGALAVYIALCGGLHHNAVHAVEAAARTKGIDTQRVVAYPSPFLPMFWNGVADDGVFLYQGPVQVPVGATPGLPLVRLKNLDHPAVKAVLAHPLGQRFVHWWAESPVAEVRCSSRGVVVVLSDVRFLSPWLEGSGFQLRWRVDYERKTGSYTVRDYRWTTPWKDEPLPDGDCVFRMERDMAKSQLPPARAANRRKHSARTQPR